MADIDRHELHTLADHIPANDLPAARARGDANGSDEGCREMHFPRRLRTGQ